MKRLGLAMVAAFGWSLAAWAVPVVVDGEKDRYQALINELRCVVCQNQSIAESNAPLAQDLRGQVASQINEGRSDAEIRSYLTDRYGDFVLYNPPLRLRTALLWFGPFLLLVLGVVIVIRQTRRPTAPASPMAADGDRLRRLLDRHQP